jgi:hypothetical protein
MQTFRFDGLGCIMRNLAPIIDAEYLYAKHRSEDGWEGESV